MLSFPTPRPPAQIRRASCRYKSSPPPPYAHAFPPLSPTGLEDGNLSGYSDSGTSENSREELSGIFVKADGLIRERQRELSFTSELSRELRSSNLALKKTHDDLLARLPSPTLASTPLGSRTPTPHFYSNSLSRNDTSPKPYRGRRISVSPGELALLSDQNAELLSKLERLEEESAQADRIGKRRLGKLESEIQQLQRELDESRARSEALEEHAMELQRGSEVAARKKQEREERLKHLRGKPEDSQHSHLDFAPASTILSSPSMSQNPPESPPDSPPQDASLSDTSLLDSLPSDLREHTLISQLLLKVHELEKANQQIGQHQRDTTAKLREAQREAEIIRRLYALLDDNDGVEIQVIEDDEPTQVNDDTVQEPLTLRFRSLRRTVGLPFESSFKHGIHGDMHGTARSGAPKTGKVRKSVVGLFDSPTRLVDAASSSIPTTSPDYVTETQLHGPEEAIISPTLSSPDFSGGDRFAAFLATQHPTLGSELGSEFSDGWTSPGNHHHRTSSLYDAFSTSPSTSPCPPERPLPRAKTSSGDDPTYTVNPTFAFPPSRSALSPRPFDGVYQTSTKTGSTRSHRLSQTVRSRTHKWVDKRFQDTLQSPKSSTPPPTVEGGQDLVLSPVSTTMTAIDRVFDVVDAAVEKIAHAVPAGVLPADHELKRPAVVAHDSTHDRSADKAKPGRVTSLFLELWLWLQFAVIIFVFLWAMARRGPKNILQDADRKRTRLT